MIFLKDRCFCFFFLMLLFFLLFYYSHMKINNPISKLLFVYAPCILVNVHDFSRNHWRYVPMIIMHYYHFRKNYFFIINLEKLDYCDIFHDIFMYPIIIHISFVFLNSWYYILTLLYFTHAHKLIVTNNLNNNCLTLVKYEIKCNVSYANHYFCIIYLYWPRLSAAIATPNIYRYIHTSLYYNYLNNECD